MTPTQKLAHYTSLGGFCVKVFQAFFFAVFSHDLILLPSTPLFYLYIASVSFSSIVPRITWYRAFQSRTKIIAGLIFNVTLSMFYIGTGIAMIYVMCVRNDRPLESVGSCGMFVSLLLIAIALDCSLYYTMVVQCRAFGKRHRPSLEEPPSAEPLIGRHEQQQQQQQQHFPSTLPQQPLQPQ